MGDSVLLALQRATKADALIPNMLSSSSYVMLRIVLINGSKSLFFLLFVFFAASVTYFWGVGRLWKLGRGAERNYGGEGWVGYFFLGKRCLSATFFLGLVGS